MSNILDKEQIQSIKICGQYLKAAIFEAAKAIKPGISTLELDQIAEESLVQNGCKPAFKNYYVAGSGHFPASLCVSVNDEIVHGLPSKTRILEEGDIVSLDLGAEYEGVFTDMAITVPVGKISTEAERLIAETKRSLEIGIDQARAGNRLGDLGAEIEKYALSNNLGIVRDYVGHGIGTAPHLPPQIPNFGEHGTGQEIIEGEALAIEPMMTLGGGETVTLTNGWTVSTEDGSLAAHFEHTVVIENGQPVVVTK